MAQRVRPNQALTPPCGARTELLIAGRRVPDACQIGGQPQWTRAHGSTAVALPGGVGSLCDHRRCAGGHHQGYKADVTGSNPVVPTSQKIPC